MAFVDGGQGKAGRSVEGTTGENGREAVSGLGGLLEARLEHRGEETDQGVCSCSGGTKWACGGARIQRQERTRVGRPPMLRLALWYRD